MIATPAILVAVATLFGGAFFMNEWSHGAVAEGLGLGHHHVFDTGGYHCVAHDDVDHAAHHLEHMHGDAPRRHGHCPGGGAMHADGMMGDGTGMPGQPSGSGA